MISSDDITPYHALKRHQEAIEAFTAFISMIPSNEPLNPLMRLLASNLKDSFIPLEPFVLSDSVKR
ncbi:hypothetical protein B6B49_25030 [Salmonella enterica]|nr:hypothetical protein [Salmonella enterica]